MSGIAASVITIALDQEDNGASFALPELSRLEAALLLAFSIQMPFSGTAL
jgi:hypothetical protein